MKRFKGSRKLVWIFVFLLLIIIAISVRPAAAQTSIQTIFIQPDGNIYPNNVPIQRNGNIYTLTDNIYAPIKIEKSNIVLNGAGYTLNGPYNGTASGVWIVGTGPDQNASTADYIMGVDTTNVDGITVENLNIRNFSIGMYMWTKNNTVVGNSVSNGIIGILLSGSNTKIIGNNIANNGIGLFFGFNNPGDIPYDITISQNSFYQNSVQLQGCQCKEYNLSETIHTWDNGKQGNYWSDYNGTDANGDGIGDTPYTIDPLDQDRYPLMQNQIQPPIQATPDNPVLPLAVGLSVPAVLIPVAFALRYRAKRKAAIG